jgi:endonuclease-3
MKSKPEVKTYIKLFKRYYPDAHCALEHKNPEELLIATVLSAQCTDERVNQVTKVLFNRYPDLMSLAQAELKDVEEIVRPTGFYKNKAKNILSLARTLVEKNGGLSFQTMDELIGLPGVGRKTANVVLGNAFNMATGVVVDTHVQRLSRRLGLTRQSTPEKIEIDLMGIVPKKDWVQFSHWLIWHGRQICKARKPQCEKCFLDSLCPKIK